MPFLKLGVSGDKPAFVLIVVIKKYIYSWEILNFCGFKCQRTFSVKDKCTLGRLEVRVFLDFGLFSSTSRDSWDAHESAAHPDGDAGERGHDWFWYGHRLLRSLSSMTVWNQDAKTMYKPAGLGVPAGAAHFKDRCEFLAIPIDFLFATYCYQPWAFCIQIYFSFACFTSAKLRCFWLTEKLVA